MLHMQCMWGVIHEIGCSLQDIDMKHVLSLGCAHTWVASHLINLKLPLVSFGIGCITQMPYITACCHESRMSHREPHTPHLITMAY